MGMNRDTNIPLANLSLQTLIRECSLHKISDYDLYQNLALMNRENIHQVFRYRKFRYDFVDFVTNYTNGEYIVGNIRPSYDDFLYHIVSFLNLREPGKIEDDSNLTEKLYDRVKRLKSIQSEFELLEEFPVLYDDYIQGRKFIQTVEGTFRKTEEEKKRYEEDRHYYYACALKRNLKNFLDTQSELYYRFITNRMEYKNLIESKNFNAYFREHFDQNKLAMYSIHEYLTICEYSTSLSTIQKYLKYITMYRESSYDKSCVLTLEDGRIVDWESLESRMNSVWEEWNSSQTLIPWILVPNGEKISKVKKEKNNTEKVSVLNYEEMEHLRKVGEEKNEFYENTPYSMKAIGLHKNRGYVAYIYPNGEVLLDRIYDDKHPKTALGDAIYSMKASDFEELSRYDKSVLFHHSKVGRIIHSKSWKEKAMQIIEREGTSQEKEDAKILVKRLGKN